MPTRVDNGATESSWMQHDVGVKFILGTVLPSHLGRGVITLPWRLDSKSVDNSTAEYVLDEARL
jgi:hypothetical protein